MRNNQIIHNLIRQHSVSLFWNANFRVGCFASLATEAVLQSPHHWHFVLAPGFDEFAVAAVVGEWTALGLIGLVGCDAVLSTNEHACALRRPTHRGHRIYVLDWRKCNLPLWVGVVGSRCWQGWAGIRICWFCAPMQAGFVFRRRRAIEGLPSVEWGKLFFKK